MSTAPSASVADADYRKYRRVLAVVALVVAFSGTAWVLVSVAVTIARRDRPAEGGPRVGPRASAAELRACLAELLDGARALEKHLENFRFLMGSYDARDAQTWAEEGARWRERWNHLGERCRLNHAAQLRGAHAAMAIAHRELAELHTHYTRELTRLGSQHAPRLAQLRLHLEVLADQLGGDVETTDPPSLESTP